MDRPTRKAIAAIVMLPFLMLAVIVSPAALIWTCCINIGVRLDRWATWGSTRGQ